MTINEAITFGSKLLPNSPTGTLDAELILGSILKLDRSSLISQSRREISPDHETLYKSFVQERHQGKPIAYITHEKEFFGRSFFVDERVMIPRPETEEMVEDALKLIRNESEPSTVIDLGTGSGAIVITMALELPDHQVIGLDISPEALEVAEINKKRHNCKNLSLLESDLLSDLPSTLDSRPLTILANLPYIGTQTNHFISDETHRHEPHLALYGGKDGLDLYRRTWQQLSTLDHRLQALFMEIGFSQVEAISQECMEAFPDYQLEIKNDLAGLPRTAVLSQPHSQSPHHSSSQ